MLECMGLDKQLEAVWKVARRWLDEASPEAEGFLELLEVTQRLVPDFDAARWRALPLEVDRAHLELWLLEQLQGEPEECKHETLWFRVRPHTWKGRVDGGDLVLERLLPEARGVPTSEFSQPLRDDREASLGPALLAALLHESGRCRELEDGARLAALLAGPLAIGALAWAVQTTLERLSSSLLLGPSGGRDILVGHDGGPALALGRCGLDSWYRDSVGLYA